MSKGKEARGVKVVASSESAQQAPSEPAKPAGPDYGVLKEIVFERTVSVRQYEPLRMEFHYSVGKDDNLEHTLEVIKQFSDLIDAKFHPAGPEPAPKPAMPVVQRPPQRDNPQTQFPQTTQAPSGQKGWRMPTKFEGESDDEFYGRVIKRCYAIWHNELHEREDCHPKVLGVKDLGTALEYIKQYQAGA